MTTTATTPPILGELIDPPPRPVPAKVMSLDSREDRMGTSVGIGYRAFNRFSVAKAPLLAAGTTYYLFLAMFALIAFGYGLAATIGSDQVAAYLTDALGDAFPGLLGDSGIDPDQLRAIGRTTSLVGLLGLLYGGSGGVGAAKQSIHTIYGAPKDPRNVVVARLLSLLWLVVLGPLVLLSFAASTVTAQFSAPIFEALGIDSTLGRGLLVTGSVVATLGVNFLIAYLVLSRFGGIRPPKRALMIGSALSAVVVEILKGLMSLLVGFTIDRPEYGALAAPIGILFVLFLQSMAMYAAASVTAGIADKDVPLVDLVPGAAEAEAEAATEQESPSPS